jgi:hypothetical protein
MKTALTRRPPASTDLTHYDPQQGVKRIAVAAMAEKHYARAKDATKLIEAIRAKLEAQAEFVLWWDTQAEKSKGGDAKTYGRNRSVTAVESGKNGLPDRMTISRWRAKLNDPEAFERTFAGLCAQYPKLIEFEKGDPHVSHNSGENEWYTPRELIAAAHEVMGGIDLDPASSVAANVVVQAARIFTLADDGRVQEWHGRVWMNPPYATPLISDFCEKLAASVEAGTVTQAVVLVNNATETQWFHRLASVAVAMCFPLGRVRFWNPAAESATPLQGQALIYCGSDRQRFTDAFENFGCVLWRS